MSNDSSPSRWLCSLIFLAISGLLISPTSAAPVIRFGDDGLISLKSNTADQSIQFFFDSDGQTFLVDGLEFNIQVGDGGEDLGGTRRNPVITSIDLINGTVFQDASPNPVDVVSFPLARQSTVDTGGRLVDPNGLIATVTFSTLGLDELGDFDLRLGNVAGAFDTRFFSGVDPITFDEPIFNQSNAMIRISAVPEPGSLIALPLLGLICRRRRRRRKNAPRPSLPA